MLLYNKLLKIFNNTKYPFNLISNLKDNIINTKNEIEIEYIKDLSVFKETKENIAPRLGKSGGSITKKNIYVYEY